MNEVADKTVETEVGTEIKMLETERNVANQINDVMKKIKSEISELFIQKVRLSNIYFKHEKELSDQLNAMATSHGITDNNNWIVDLEKGVYRKVQ